jgi:hypothetical protein
MGDIRKSHPPNFKYKIAAMAISGEKTLAVLSSKVQQGFAVKHKFFIYLEIKYIAVIARTYLYVQH